MDRSDFKSLGDTENTEGLINHSSVWLHKKHRQIIKSALKQLARYIVTNQILPCACLGYNIQVVLYIMFNVEDVIIQLGHHPI